MRRRRDAEASNERLERMRPRWVRPAWERHQQEDAPETLNGAACTPAELPDALLNLCGRFGLEEWAGERDDRGLWAFGLVLAGWLERSEAALPVDESRLEAIRLLTNLFIVLGAVVRPLAERPIDAEAQAAAAVAAARHTLGDRDALVASFPGAARAVQRVVRVRGWARLTVAQQSLAEALLWLYLEALAATLADPDSETLLTASEAWLTVIRLQALPTGFDERMLRASSWYLEAYAAALGRASQCRPVRPSRAR